MIMEPRKRVGLLTPSSNAVAEPFANAILSSLQDVSTHVSRFRVTKNSFGHFDDTNMIRAAELLADVEVDVIACLGTSGSWLHLEYEEHLCERISDATGVSAITPGLAFREIFTLTGASRIGLVSPHPHKVQEQLITTWKEAGMHCIAERHLCLQSSVSFGKIGSASVANLIREVSEEGCDAVAIVCADMCGAGFAESLEAEIGVPVYDSIAVSLWKSLLTAGIDPLCVSGWGSLFAVLPDGWENAAAAASAAETIFQD